MISIPEGDFIIAEACAGLRFLIASIAFGAFFAVMVYRSWWRRLAFLALSMIVPIIANGIRAWGILYIAHLTNDVVAVEADHVVYGWGFFSAIILLLIVIGTRFSDGGPALSAAKAPAAPAPGFGVRAPVIATALAVALAALGPIYAAGGLVVDPLLLHPAQAPGNLGPWLHGRRGLLPSRAREGTSAPPPIGKWARGRESCLAGAAFGRARGRGGGGGAKAAASVLWRGGPLRRAGPSSSSRPAPRAPQRGLERELGVPGDDPRERRKGRPQRGLAGAGRGKGRGSSDHDPALRDNAADERQGRSVGAAGAEPRGRRGRRREQQQRRHEADGVAAARALFAAQEGGPLCGAGLGAVLAGRASVFVAGEKRGRAGRGGARGRRGHASC